MSTRTRVEVRVDVDWSGPGHYDPAEAKPCEVCATPTQHMTKDGVRCHKSCFEDLIVRELLGQAQTRIVDERVPTFADAAGER